MITSADEFKRLRTSDDLDEQDRATHEPADEQVWLEVVARFPELRSWVARNKTVPLSILRLLAADPDPDVRSEVAMKRKLDRALFEALADDPDPGVRRRLIWNRQTPADLLARLATDPLLAADAAERMRATAD
ncbi:hypothetical protein [Caulobacter sp. 17J65-9]|uniref:hypothetical protein n=1 Tax=Caulobacter sp. 17J65-9 TaxID=2709382 RepID=UPI0013C5BB6F|nr:hypothetical protein [Caulobacter sp. 17J65-9]NEX94857.1 hypothetical protein [Caulobacter sp. 17J65-9]